LARPRSTSAKAPNSEIGVPAARRLRSAASATAAPAAANERSVKSMPSALRILCLSGPNLALLGTREPEMYGTTTLHEIETNLVAIGRAENVRVECRQSDHEGELVAWIGNARGKFDGILLNAAAYTHTSVALLDALRAVAVPCIEVHLSQPGAREPFRHRSYVARAAVGVVSGFGAASYTLALRGLMDLLQR
jgi:3-dehydroquinate dehydratase II